VSLGLNQMLSQRELFLAVRKVLVDSTWPVAWRLTDRDVLRGCEELLSMGRVSFAGSVWVMPLRVFVDRVAYDHVVWLEWFRLGNKDVFVASKNA